ncbi:MAG: MFS transporter [Oscillospiraceae bacterium]|jgi:MFS family permease
MSNPFSALKTKNFRIYWLGMAVSTIGTWMQNIAQPWLAYKLTDSALRISLVSALQYLPMLLLALFAGVFVDRVSKKKILLFTQSASLGIVLVIALLVSSGTIQYWHLLVAAAALGCVNTLDMPARQAFLNELVPKEELMDAIALNSAVFNMARTIGPAVAGVVMEFWGIAACFYGNALSFAAVVISLFFIHSKPSVRSLGAAPRFADMKRDILDGLRYMKEKKILLLTLMGLFTMGIFALNFSVLVPVFSKTVLGQAESGYGFLMSCMGMGSFVGAMLVAVQSKKKPTKLVLYGFPILSGLSLIALALTRSYAPACAAIAFAGYFIIRYTATANSVLQTSSDPEHLGRVMSAYTLVFAGTTPLGNLFAGSVAQRFGAAAGFLACGGSLLLLLLPINIYRVRLSRTEKIEPEE